MTAPATVAVRVDSGLWLDRRSLPETFVGAVNAALSLANPEHAQRVRLG